MLQTTATAYVVFRYHNTSNEWKCDQPQFRIAYFVPGKAASGAIRNKYLLTVQLCYNPINRQRNRSENANANAQNHKR